jgi:hypothetical protein
MRALALFGQSSAMRPTLGRIHPLPFVLALLVVSIFLALALWPRSAGAQTFYDPTTDSTTTVFTPGTVAGPPSSQIYCDSAQGCVYVQPPCPLAPDGSCANVIYVPVQTTTIYEPSYDPDARPHHPEPWIGGPPVAAPATPNGGPVQQVVPGSSYRTQQGGGAGSTNVPSSRSFQSGGGAGAGGFSGRSVNQLGGGAGAGG